MLALLLLAVTFHGVQPAAKDLPSYFPRCNIDDPKINDCLIKATDTVRPYLKKGVPELKIPSLDPFIIPEISLEQGTQAVNFKASITNIKVNGLTDYKFTKYIFDIPKLEFDCEMVIQHLYLTGIYAINGKILLAPIQGKGNFRANATDTRVKVFQKVKLVTRHGIEYVAPVITKTQVELGNAKANLDGLFDGSEVLAKATNDLINDNIKELFDEIKPELEKVITKIVEDLLFASIESSIPFSKLYPKSKN